jgi:hypothetical protein
VNPHQRRPCHGDGWLQTWIGRQTPEQPDFVVNGKFHRYNLLQARFAAGIQRAADDSEVAELRRGETDDPGHPSGEASLVFTPVEGDIAQPESHAP